MTLATQAEQAGWDGVRVGDAVGVAAARVLAVLGALAEAVPRVRLEAVVAAAGAPSRRRGQAGQQRSTN